LQRDPEKIWSSVKLQARRSHHLQQLERAIKPKQSAILWLVVPKRPHVRFDERDLETGPLPQGAPISPLLVNLYYETLPVGMEATRRIHCTPTIRYGRNQTEIWFSNPR